MHEWIQWYYICLVSGLYIVYVQYKTFFMAQLLCVGLHVQSHLLSDFSLASAVDKQAQGKHSPCLVRIYYLQCVLQILLTSSNRIIVVISHFRTI